MTPPRDYENVNVAFNGAEDFLYVFVGDIRSKGRHRNGVHVRTNSELRAALKICQSPICRHRRRAVS